MTRPLHIWIIFGAALSVLLLATAWVSVAVWRLDEAQFRTQLQADHEEKVRLALWRMDSYMSPLIVEEAARPLFHYRAFHTPEKVYSKSMTAVSEVMIPSPLLAYRSSNVVLHFQMDARGRVASPQAPEGRERELALAGNVSPAKLATAEARLQELRAILGTEVEAGRAQTIASADPQRPLSNRDLLLLSCSPFRTNVVPLTSGTTTQQPSSQTAHPEQAQWVPVFPQQRAVAQQQQQQQEPLSNLKASSIVNWGQSKQQYLNTAEQTARANVYQDIVQKESAYGSAGFAGQWNAEEGPIRPLWVGSELLLARRGTLEGGSYIQGAWLHWENLRASLLAGIRDLFSRADLEAMTMPLGEIDSRMMASIPVKLITAPEIVGAAPFWTPIRVSLAIAWLCVLFAGVAVAVLLHGVISLSERRGDFVSSVTHELRTPLTTFRMYSEMLADGMVAEEERRRAYLQTLCAESNRLSHLVENVLTYARLERGHANKRRERIALGRLVERMESRLGQRAEHGGMRLEVGMTPDISELEVETDVSAVEQILFNLVDNACKYAGPSADNQTIHLEARRHGRMAELVVRDHGPGLAKDVMKRLFKPFSKSAQEAASSAPGVGLGLALCRRLSRGTGAQLSYQGNADEGARFILRIPMAER